MFREHPEHALKRLVVIRREELLDAWLALQLEFQKAVAALVGVSSSERPVFQAGSQGAGRAPGASDPVRHGPALR